MTYKTSAAAVGVDVGGTKIAAGIITPAGEVLLPRTVPTPVSQGPQAVLQAIIEQVADLLKVLPEQNVQAVGIGTAGLVDAERGVIIHANPNLPGWTGMAMGEGVRAAVGLPVYVDNDVNALALGEGRFGAGQGLSEILYVAVGTGIGGAIVRGGRIWRGTHYSAGEVAAVLAGWDEQGRPVNVEDRASGTALEKRYQALCGSATRVSLRDIATQARSGDALSIRVIEEGARILGAVLWPLVAVLDPEILIVGGGVPGIGDLWWQPFERALRDSPFPALQVVKVAPAGLSAHAGLVGAGALALSMLEL